VGCSYAVPRCIGFMGSCRRENSVPSRKLAQIKSQKEKKMKRSKAKTWNASAESNKGV